MTKRTTKKKIPPPRFSVPTPLAFHPASMPQSERLRAWEDAGAPTQKGANGGRQYFGMDFTTFATMCHCYALTAPDLSMTMSTGLGYNEVDGWRAFVFAAALPGYFWVAVQRSATKHMQTTYLMDTFPAACREADVLPTIARWAPGVKFHWASNPGARQITVPFGWRVPERFTVGAPRLLTVVTSGEAGEWAHFTVTTRAIVHRPHTRILSICGRPKQLAYVQERFAAFASEKPGWFHLNKKLYRLILKWGAVHFHNMVLGKDSK
jgi:hypothetical protein